MKQRCIKLPCFISVFNCKNAFVVRIKPGVALVKKACNTKNSTYSTSIISLT